MDFSLLGDLTYTKEHLLQLEAIEKELNFTRFDSKDAYDLGTIIVNEVKKYNQDIVIVITRETDKLPIFQYVMNSKVEQNIDYANLKRNCVLETGHCSLWKLVNGLVQKQPIEEIFNSKTSIPVGGAFPIYIGNQLVATLAISGLHSGLDQEVIIKSLCTYLDKKVCEFTGKLI